MLSALIGVELLREIRAERALPIQVEHLKCPISSTKESTLCFGPADRCRNMIHPLLWTRVGWCELT